jgi:hypothetical protein
VFSVTGRVEQPVPRAVSGALGGGGAGQGEGDPLLAHVDLAGVSVQEAPRVSLPAWARPVIVGDAADGAVPLLWAGERDGQRVALLAFDLRRSDLPLQVAFPLLLANLTAWLAPSGGSDLPDQVTPGTVVSLSLPPDVDAVLVTRPDGSQSRLPVSGGQAVVVDTRQLGVYGIEWGAGGAGGEAHFAVNLYLPRESDILPAEVLAGGAPLGAEGASAPLGSPAGAQPERAARREWWRLLALAALALLVAEWAVYHRAAIARLWSGLKRQTPGTRRRPET